LTNSGISLRYGRYHIRAFKGDRGSLRGPGYSRGRLRFCQQLALWPDTTWDADASVNLALIWEPGPNRLLNYIALACPRDAAPNARRVEVYWQVEVPHPALAHDAAPADEPSGDLGEPEDLDITLPDAPATGTGPMV
jgi:hypothetical protein